MLRLLIAFCLIGIVLSSSLSFKIDAHKEECFYDDVINPGQKVFFAYQVTQGGALDIDVTVYDPSDDVLYLQERETDSRVLLVAADKGTHKFCFSNRMSTLTAKSVMFQIVVGDPSENPKKKTAVTATVDRSIMRMTEALNEIRIEQSYLRTRERVHRDTAESTNARVLWGSVVQSTAMVALSAIQMFYLKRCFETRRNV
jgi:hypothetical protein